MLDSWLRRVTTYLFVEDLVRGRSVLELEPDGVRSLELLQHLGAAEAVGVGRAVQPHKLRGLELISADPVASGLTAARFDLILCLEVGRAQLAQVVSEAKRLARATGVVVLGAQSRDLPGAQDGLSYFELEDALRAEFPAVQMLGQAPFAAATLVEYGTSEPEPVLDGRLVASGEAVERYVALGGAALAPRGYGVVQVPHAQFSAAAPEAAAASRAQVEALELALRQSREALERLEADKLGVVLEAEEREGQIRVERAELEELRQQLAARQRGMEELGEASLLHAREMEELRAELDERDARLAELEAEAGAREALTRALEQAERRSVEAEARERDTRRRLAEAEGVLLRRQAPGQPGSALEVEELRAKVAELEAANTRLQAKEEEARADSWKHLKARSDAEAAAAEVREETVRKLKDARKLASVELTRAMEEATKKAVSLREELLRSERERKEALEGGRAALSELEELKRELDQARATSEPRSSDEELEAARGERERVERERVERERVERERLERQVERVTAAAAHERARAERLVEEERQALAERNEARSRAIQAERQAATLAQEREDLGRALAEAESRAAASPEMLARLQDRLSRIEHGLRGEEERLGHIEAALEQAAGEARGLDDRSE